MSEDNLKNNETDDVIEDVIAEPENNLLDEGYDNKDNKINNKIENKIEDEIKEPLKFHFDEDYDSEDDLIDNIVIGLDKKGEKDLLHFNNGVLNLQKSNEAYEKKDIIKRDILDREKHKEGVFDNIMKDAKNIKSVYYRDNIEVFTMQKSFLSKSIKAISLPANSKSDDFLAAMIKVKNKTVNQMPFTESNIIMFKEFLEKSQATSSINLDEIKISRNVNKEFHVMLDSFKDHRLKIGEKLNDDKPDIRNESEKQSFKEINEEMKKVMKEEIKKSLLEEMKNGSNSNDNPENSNKSKPKLKV